MRTRLFSAVVVALTAQALHAQASPADTHDEGSPPIVRKLRDLQHEYARATAKRDTVALRAIEPPDATFHYPDGTTGTGKTDFAAVASGAVTLDSYRLNSLRVRVLAPTVAVITGHASIRGSAKLAEGGRPQDLSGEFRFIDVWRQRAGRWQIAAGQYTRIGGQ
jgi:ketosteroid isomerase-like protein